MSQISSQDKYEQVSMKEGVKQHRTRAMDAVLTDYEQLDNKKIVDLQNDNDLTTEEKREMLNLLTMVNEKRNGKIKGRVFVEGRKQRRHIKR